MTRTLMAAVVLLPIFAYVAGRYSAPVTFVRIPIATPGPCEAPKLSKPIDRVRA